MEVVFVKVGLLYNKFHKNIGVSGSLEYKLDLHFGRIIKKITYYVGQFLSYLLITLLFKANSSGRPYCIVIIIEYISL